MSRRNKTEDLIEQMEALQNSICILEVESKFMRARNERLEAENEYLKNQVDVLLKVVAKNK